MDVDKSLADLKKRIKLRIDEKYLSTAIRKEIERLSEEGFSVSVPIILRTTTPFYGELIRDILISMPVRDIFLLSIDVIVINIINIVPGFCYRDLSWLP